MLLVVVAMFVFGVVLLLVGARSARRKPPALLGEAQEDGWELLPTQELPASSPLNPPRWLIEGGLFKEKTGKQPAERSQEW